MKKKISYEKCKFLTLVGTQELLTVNNRYSRAVDS
jgi:hypothetical protein